jgi:hypothetical protein
LTLKLNKFLIDKKKISFHFFKRIHIKIYIISYYFYFYLFFFLSWEIKLIPKKLIKFEIIKTFIFILNSFFLVTKKVKMINYEKNFFLLIFFFFMII